MATTHWLPEQVDRRQSARIAARAWFPLFILALFVYTGLPFLAPLLMHVGWPVPARGIYLLYSLLCHQLPERSYFLFGPRFTYSLSQIQAAWQDTRDPWILRQFLGNPELGWKVAWSDRMVSMFTSIPLFGLLWWPLRRKLKPLPWWGFVLFLLPLALDGTSHFFSDLFGIGLGFRDTNAWLAALTGSRLPAWFYIGDAWGSFNSLMRLLSGLLFGLGLVWFSFPLLDRVCADHGMIHSFESPYGDFSNSPKPNRIYYWPQLNSNEEAEVGLGQTKAAGGKKDKPAKDTF